MDEFELQYTMAKQLPTAREIHSNYGTIELDDEMRSAVEAALVPILERRLKQAQKGES